MFIGLKFLSWVADVEMEKKDKTLNYLNAKITESIYTMEFKTREIFLTYYIRHYYIWRCTQCDYIGLLKNTKAMVKAST